MKKTFLIFTSTLFLAGTLLVSCQSSADKVENAEDKVAEAKKELSEARKDSILEFKKETEAKLTHYEKSLEELKAGVSKQKKELKADYEKKVADLEKKNNEMKVKLENYKDDAEGTWASFRAEFLHDMDEMGKAFEDLGVKNVK